MNTWICDSCGDRLAHDGKQSYSVAQKELSKRAEKAEARVAELEEENRQNAQLVLDIDKRRVARVAELEAKLRVEYENAEGAMRDEEAALRRVVELEAGIKALPCNRTIWCKPGKPCEVHALVQPTASVSTGQCFLEDCVVPMPHTDHRDEDGLALPRPGKSRSVLRREAAQRGENPPQNFHEHFREVVVRPPAPRSSDAGVGDECPCVSRGYNLKDSVTGKCFRCNDTRALSKHTCPDKTPYWQECAECMRIFEERCKAPVRGTNEAPPETIFNHGLKPGVLVRNPETGALGIVAKVRLRGASVTVGKHGKTQYWRDPEVVGHIVQRVDKAPSTLSERTLRDLLRLIVGHLEVDAKAGDGIHEDAYDDYHAACMVVGQAGEGWDADAAGRAMRRITGDEWWTAPKEIQ